MILYLVRHGEAEKGEPDELRRLTAAGRDQGRAVARQLENDGVRPETVVSSPLLRARETAELIAHPFGLDPEIDDRLGSGATTADVRAAVEGRGSVVVAIAHEPDCGHVAGELGGDGRPFAAGEMRALDLE
jgi:phosphohistidine phosphatase